MLYDSDTASLVMLELQEEGQTLNSLVEFLNIFFLPRLLTTCCYLIDNSLN